MGLGVEAEGAKISEDLGLQIGNERAGEAFRASPLDGLGMEEERVPGALGEGEGGGGEGIGGRKECARTPIPTASNGRSARLVESFGPLALRGHMTNNGAGRDEQFGEDVFLSPAPGLASVIGANVKAALPGVLEATAGVNETIVDDEWGRTQGSGIHIPGRVVLNMWRLMRGEVKLPIYTMESVVEAVLRKKLPRFSWRQLTAWFAGGAGGARWRCVNHLLGRARLNLEILDQMDLVNRTAELARVFGIDFFSVLSRGSQYRVESMMVRLCRTQNYVPLSPSRMQVSTQPAMESIPLVMEPESRLYTSPVIVLDFQSLYPSMIIAYNICFSTCLGRVARPDASTGKKKLGVTDLGLPAGVLSALRGAVRVLPNNVMYVKPEVRAGVLPRLLQEILTTRIMVKKAMKKLPSSAKVLHRILNARQFALKLIANVTYGYTAAGFSGRMPCAEIADSIVQTGRQTLERAIAVVNEHPRWGARVVYGDTDSMFVLLEGRTRERAFEIGNEIVSVITNQNPPPIALKLEKVYQPCFLLMKKRYVGYAYESPKQMVPIFDAKGIETVRRDSCPAVAKTMERTLRMVFESKDLSQVKAYLQRQWMRILKDRVSIKDFVFAKEVRLGSYSARAAVLPPAAIVAAKAMAKDPRAEPRYGERVPYVVVYGEPGARLVDLVVDPHLLVENSPALRLHGLYYITKQIIPSLQRVFGLVGADLRAWFAEMPRVVRPPATKRTPALGASSLWREPNDGNGDGSGRAANERHAAAGGATNMARVLGGSETLPGVEGDDGEREGGKRNGGGLGGGFDGEGRSEWSSKGEKGGAFKEDANWEKDGAPNDRNEKGFDRPVGGRGKREPGGSKGPGGVRGLWIGAGGSNSANGGGRGIRGGTIDQYYLSRHCGVCGELTAGGEEAICEKCRSQPQGVAAMLTRRAAKAEHQYSHLIAICRHCGGNSGQPGGDPIACVSLDCEFYYERKKVGGEARAAAALASSLGLYPDPEY
eukprot:TRINITY_DN21469_c0_g2_i1.p1 TRINITY_DN21469_c0_g2~~TRINITY_DN21469_c0_g2_i1.p1  ORF type:complete len:1040 (-),score=209.68 TRINITY_DN21469_c0_g2_i1:154-3132(-)